MTIPKSTVVVANRSRIENRPVPFARIEVAELENRFCRRPPAQQLSARQPIEWKRIASLITDFEMHRGVRKILRELRDRGIARHSGSDRVGIHQPTRDVLHRDTYADTAQNRRQLIARSPQVLLRA